MKSFRSGVLLSGALLALVPPFAARALGSATSPDFRIGQQWRLSSSKPVQGAPHQLEFKIVRLLDKNTQIYGGTSQNKTSAVQIYADPSDNSLTLFDSEGLREVLASDQKDPLVRLCLFSYKTGANTLKGVSIHKPRNEMKAFDPGKLSDAYVAKYPHATSSEVAQYVGKTVGNSGNCTLELIK